MQLYRCEQCGDRTEVAVPDWSCENSAADLPASAAVGLTPEKQKEVDSLNLDPRQREILVGALIDYPELSVQAALAMLNNAGM